MSTLKEMFGVDTPESSFKEFQAQRRKKFGDNPPDWLDDNHWVVEPLKPGNRKELVKQEGPAMVPPDTTHWAHVTEQFVHDSGHVPPEALFSPVRGWWTCGDDPPAASGASA